MRGTTVALDYDAIAALAGIPKKKIYIDHDGIDDESEPSIFIDRYADDVRINTEWFDAYQIGAVLRALEEACKDAIEFKKSIGAWSIMQAKNLNCEIHGDCVGNVYQFSIARKTYYVHLMLKFDSGIYGRETSITRDKEVVFKHFTSKDKTLSEKVAEAELRKFLTEEKNE